MVDKIAVEVLVILILVLANGMFAMSEIALVAARKTRLQELARRGSSRAATALDLANTPDRFLSTIQIGITLIGVFAGAFGGATIATEIDAHLETIPALAPYSEALGVGTVVLGITYLSLVVGELAPKRIALNAPERISMFVAPVMKLISTVAAPVVFLLTLSTRLVLRLLRVGKSEEPPVTEEELRALLWVGARSGTISIEERSIIERAFRLDDRSVGAVMTPRKSVEWLDSTISIEMLRRQVISSAHEWFPVARGDLDTFVGIVRGRDLWSELADESGLAGVIRDPLTVPNATSALSIVERFRETRSHLAVVVNESGVVRGLVTPTDILEALVGELPEAGDTSKPMIIEWGEDGKSWSVDARTDLDEVKLLAQVQYLDGQKNGYQTTGGYVVDHLGPTPGRGESFLASGLEFRVLETDGRRIDRVLVTVVDVADSPVA